MLNTQSIFDQLKKYHREQRALTIIQMMVIDELKGDLEPLTLWEVMEQQADGQGYREVPYWFFTETGITEEAFTLFLQEHGYKPTEGEDYVNIGTTEEGLIQYLNLERYLNYLG